MHGCHDSHTAIATAKLVIIADIPNCRPHITSHSTSHSLPSRTTAGHNPAGALSPRHEAGPQGLPRQLLPHAAVGIPYLPYTLNSRIANAPTAWRQWAHHTDYQTVRRQAMPIYSLTQSQRGKSRHTYNHIITHNYIIICIWDKSYPAPVMNDRNLSCGITSCRRRESHR